MTQGEVVIFTDEPGWHGRSLVKQFAARGYLARFVSLCDCLVDLSAPMPRIEIPGFEQMPSAAFVRGVAGGSLEEVIARLNILHLLDMLGVPVFNLGRAIERTVDKSLTTFLLRHHAVPSPRTWAMESAAAARAIVETEISAGRSLVLKPLFGSQGKGVVRLDSMADFAANPPSTGVYYLQEYIASSNADFRDWRVFVINGKAVSAMLRRSTHWVTNRAQGANCEAIPNDQRLFKLAEAASRALDVDYAGVDLLMAPNGEWLVNEVNGIPAWQGLQRATKANITNLLVDAVVEKIESAPTYAASA